MDSKCADESVNTIFKNLAQVRKEEVEDAVRTVYDCFRLYLPYFHGSNEAVEWFCELCSEGEFAEAFDYVKGSFAAPGCI